MAFDIDEQSWTGKTYSEINEIGERNGSVVIIPVGSVEQHGHHLPVATDTILADAVAKHGAERVASEVPLLVAPPVWTGSSPHHMSFGGTLTTELDVLVNLLENVAGSALENDFDALLFLNGHGGNISFINDAITNVGDTHRDVEVLGITYFQLAKPFINDIRESESGGMAHGGEFETSLMMFLRSNLVNEEQLEGTYGEEPYDWSGVDLMEDGPLSVYRTFDEYSESGAIGDPTLASAEKGEYIYERLGDELEDLLRMIHEQNC